MLTDRQIQEEARKRIDQMSGQEKWSFKHKIKEGKRLAQDVASRGYKSLTKEERKLYHEYSSADLNAKGGGGIEYVSIEYAVKDHLNKNRETEVTREEIAGMKKNPFARSMWITLILVVVVGVGGVLATAAIQKATGAELGFVFIAISAATGYLSLRFAEQLMRVLRFRKLQKAYEDPKFQESEIEAAVYRLLKEEAEAEIDQDLGRN